MSTVKCAAWCGRGCTEAEYRAAVDRAAAIALELGPGWVPEIWENMGWHAAAVSACRRVRVYDHVRRDGPTTYSALIGPPNEGGGKWSGGGERPQLAVADAIAQIRHDLGLDGAGAALPGLLALTEGGKADDGSGDENGRWYLGSMNDATFIIDGPPCPSNDVGPHWYGPNAVAGPMLDEVLARKIVDAHNAALGVRRTAGGRT